MLGDIVGNPELSGFDFSSVDGVHAILDDAPGSLVIISALRSVVGLENCRGSIPCVPLQLCEPCADTRRPLLPIRAASNRCLQKTGPLWKPGGSILSMRHGPET